MSPEDPQAGLETPAAESEKDQIRVGQTYKSKDQRRTSIITINNIPLMGNRVEGESFDVVTRRKRTVLISVARLLSKYNRIS